MSSLVPALREVLSNQKEERHSIYNLPREGKCAEHHRAQGRSLQLPGFRVAVSILSRFCRGVKKAPKEEDAIVEKGPKEKDAKRNNL